MSRYDSKTHGEIASRKSDASNRRTVPRDVGPPSPAALAKLYAEGKLTPNMKAKDQSLPQDKESQRIDRTDGDTSGWVRSPNEDSIKGRPGGFVRANQDNPAKGGRCSASGDDRQRSPWSAAHNTYKE